MKNLQTYALIISDDESFAGKLKQELRTNAISKDWRSLVITNNDENPHKDLPLSKLFDLILKIKTVNVVVFFDFEKNHDLCMDLLKIFNKFKGAQHICQFCFFSEAHSKEDLEFAIAAGAHFVDYKRPDISDVINNVELLINEKHENLPTYATSEGYNSVYWPKFFGKINLINETNVDIETSFNKIDPTEDWIKRFLPNLTQANTALTNSTQLEKKCRWIEDINSLKFEYSLSKLIGCEYLNVKSVDTHDQNKAKYIYQTSKRISPDQLEESSAKSKAHMSSLNDNRVRVIVFDKKVQLLQKNHEIERLKYNLFTYPYLSFNKEDYQHISAHIVAIQWDQFSILDENANLLKLNDEKKLEALRLCIKDFCTDETVLILFGLKDSKVDKIMKRQLNVPFDITNDFLDEIVDVFDSKVKTRPFLLEKSLQNQDFNILGVDSRIKIELPIIIEQLNEHRIYFSSPVDVEHNTIIKISTPCTCYILVQNKLSDRGLYGGFLMGLKEQEKASIRQEVNRLLRIPKDQEAEGDKIQFKNLNNSEFIKRQKEKLKKSRDIVEQLKAS